ncbi:hypothetical protein TNCV_1721231 [Trichonephila clavipes]|nr:hypothetical protein TNCV_1721231 [Trichonephila clavipes]
MNGYQRRTVQLQEGFWRQTTGSAHGPPRPNSIGSLRRQASATEINVVVPRIPYGGSINRPVTEDTLQGAGKHLQRRRPFSLTDTTPPFIQNRRTEEEWYTARRIPGLGELEALKPIPPT